MAVEIPHFRLTEKQKSLLPLLSSAARNVLLYGGSRSGKTFLLCYAIATRALRAAGSRHGIFRKTGVAVKQAIGLDTMPRVLGLAYPECGARYFEQDGMFEFPNGSEIWLAGLDDKERVDKVLGREFATVYENEASEISYDAHTTLVSRLAQKARVTAGPGEFLPQKCYVDLNPTTETHWTHRLWVQGIEPIEKRPVDRSDYVFGVANPMDNRENLDDRYIASLQLLPAAKRARFFDGRYTSDNTDALWSRASIDNSRLWVRSDAELPDFRRVVIAIDPATTSNPGSNETGIIAAGIDGGGRGYVLADSSGVFKPGDWARAAVQLYRHYRADCIVAETNQGGEMVEATIRTVSPDVPIKLVHASRGKYLRAEPIAALYVRGRVVHVGELADLEAQMCVVAGTLILTRRGNIPVEDLCAEDEVLTRDGFAPIEWSGYTGEAKETIIISSSLSEIEVTPCHPIFDAKTQSFVYAGNVRTTGHQLDALSWESMGILSPGGVGGGIGCNPGIIGKLKESFFTERYLRPILGPYRRVMTFIMSMGVPETIAQRIYERLLALNILPSMSEMALMFSLAGMNTPAFSATARSLHRSQEGFCTVQGNALLPHGEVSRSRKARTHTNAFSAASEGKASNRSDIVRRNALTITGLRKGAAGRVYNLQVKGGFLPEFFANGVLVHNCSFTSGFDRASAGYSPDRLDALVWALTELFPELISDRVQRTTTQAVAYGTNYDVLDPDRDVVRMNRLAAGDHGRQQETAGMDYYPI